MRIGLNVCILSILLLSLSAMTALGARGRSEQKGRGFEPTVSRTESEWLSKAKGISGTNLVAAISFLEEKIDSDTSAALDFAVGNFYFQNDQLEDAVEAYQEALEKFPLFKNSIGNLGRIYLLQDKPSATIDLYRKLVENGVASAETYMMLGRAHLLEENYISAENAFRQTLLLAPGEDKAKRGLAKCLLQQERHKESQAVVSELLPKNPQDAELWSLRANIALALDNPGAALVAIESARRIGEADADMLSTLGDIYLNRQQPESALEAYKASFSQHPPSFDRFAKIVEALLSIGSPKRAEEMFEKSDSFLEDEQTEEQQAKLLQLKADIARQSDNNQEAFRLYERALEMEPMNGDTLLSLAELEWDADRLERAIINCERAARIEGREADALVMQAQIEVERENYSEAVELLERAQSFEDQEHVERYLNQIRELAEMQP